MAERNLDFDTVHNRRGTDSLKYDFAAARGYKEDELFRVGNTQCRLPEYNVFLLNLQKLSSFLDLILYELLMLLWIPLITRGFY